MQNMGNDPMSQLYIEIFWDKHGYLRQNRGGWPESLILHLLSLLMTILNLMKLEVSSTKG